MNEAQAYREDVLPRARGEARQAIEAATVFGEERVRLAGGDSDRFLAILRGYRSAPDVTRERMYLEAVESVLSKVGKVVMDGASQNGVLPLLSLGNPGASTTASSATQAGGTHGQAR